MKILILLSTLVMVSALTPDGVITQSVDNAPAQKLYEIGNIRADDEQAYLTLFAEALSKDSNARGYIIGYTEPRSPPGSFLSRLYGYLDYLVNSRGINSDRIVVIRGGIKDNISTEFWVVPPGAIPPRPTSEFKVATEAPVKFDVDYPDCPPEFTTSLYELEDILRFYAEALREHPHTKSQIIVYPGQRSGLRKANKMARDTKRLLAKKFGIDANRIKAVAKSRSRECSEIELWIMPVESVPSTATHNNGMQRTRTQRASYHQWPVRAADAGLSLL